MNKKFSIIVSIFNVESYIGECIDSILSQTFDNYELLLCDDNSTDSSFNILKNYNYGGADVKILQTKNNSGTAAGTRNLGLDNCSGEYVLFLDGDDTLYNNNTLHDINQIIGHDTPDIVYLGLQENGGYNRQYLSTPDNSTKEARLCCDISYSVSSRCWKRDFLNENNMRFTEGLFYEDMTFSIKGTICSKDTKVASIPIFVYRRNRPGSVMSTPSIKRCSDMYRIVAQIMDLYEDTPDEYKKYLLSFIINETESFKTKIKAILKYLENDNISLALPKRSYEFRDVMNEE